MKSQFKADHDFEYRSRESAKIREEYPGRLPLIVEKSQGSTIQGMDKRKFLVPNDISVAQFMCVIRKRLKLEPEKSIFLFVDKIVPNTSSTMGAIYAEHAEEDGFLYLKYSGENTFGKGG